MDLVRYIDSPDSAQPGAIRIPTRAEVRALVMAHMYELREADQRGDIIEHVSLDQQDRVSAYLVVLQAHYGEDAVAAFSQIWLEEMEAAASATRRETQSILDQMEMDADEALGSANQRAQSDSRAAEWIIAVIIFVVGLAIYGLFFA